MLSPAGRRASVMLALPFAAGICVFSERGATAQTADELPPAAEPVPAEPGDWAADFNEAQVGCYEGSMSACDSIWLDDRVLLDSLLGQYGRTCGGRADHREISLASLTCREAFPGHE
jgi:hypothetical protein